MKYIFSLLIIAFHLIVFSACKKEATHDPSYENYKTFICELQNQNFQYNETEWKNLETRFNNLRTQAGFLIRHNYSENAIEFAALQNEWESFRKQYAQESVIHYKSRQMEALSNELLPPGVAPDLSNVEAKNLRDVQSHFVQVVEVHKNEMSAEQWGLVNSLWIVLKSKQTEFSNELEYPDKSKIGEQTIKYKSIKANMHPVSTDAPLVLARFN